jgi:bifunctional non-homologous end joining protein LigD
MSGRVVQVGGRSLRISNLDKVLYPQAGFTKAGVLDYYARVAEAILPHLADRPVSLRRFPDGADSEGFFEKNCPDYRPDWMGISCVEHGDSTVRYCRFDEPAALVWAANLGALELHPLLCRAEHPNRPDSMVFDLDPGAPAGLGECIEVAFLLRKMLDAVQLRSWVKTSGGKGLHIYVPLHTDVTFEQTKATAQAFARTLERHRPDGITSVMRRSERPGKVFVDWSQNDAHKSTISVFSLRARPRPRVSTPVAWEELEGALAAGDPAELLQFETAEVLNDLDHRAGIFAPVLTTRQQLPGV